MHARNVHEMRTILLVELIKVGNVLEVVGVNFAIFSCSVGQHVIGELDDLELVTSLLDQRRYGVVQNHRMRSRACGHLDDLVVGCG